MTKVSVLMPVYNAGDYLSEAIDSIINQVFTDWELIIVNDGSTDNSKDIILSYNDKRIRYFDNGENKGIIYTRKFMIGKATGEYIAFLDSDDIAMETRFEKQVAFLDANPEYILCGTWGIMVDDKGDKIKKLNLTDRYQEIRCALLFGNTFIQSSIMIRKEAFDHETYDPQFPVVEDYELWCRLMFMGHRMKNIPEYLIKYRWHKSNISSAKSEMMDAYAKKVYRKELVNIGLYASESEISIHNAIRDCNTLDIEDKVFFRKLKKWLRKMTGANQLCRTYDQTMFRATVCFRWIYACKERGAYLRLFVFPVYLNLTGMKYLLRMIYIRLK